MKYNEKTNEFNKKEVKTDLSYKHKIIWEYVLFISFLHLMAFYGFITIINGVYLRTFLWGLFVGFLMLYVGIPIGAHRYYAHKTFKATPLLRFIFIICQTANGQYSMYTWVRDHRLHHRYSDTDGDPHNAKRGFFFSHMGWLMSKKHPNVKELGQKIDMSDVLADPLVVLQKKYYMPLYLLVAVFIPVAVPVYLYGETWINALSICYFFRYALTLHFTCFANSFVHLYGTRPYDKTIQPVQSWFVSLVTLGEGWHNFHHTFPWDYRAAEYDSPLNINAMLIRFFEGIGLAYDLKSVDTEMVKKRILRTGDGTHHLYGSDEQRSAVTAIGPVHPFNPTYTTKLQAP